ncbi:hypothetical protein [Pontibaca salina]|uniref:Aspartate carbamoyltransferase catalytic subunit n=1 Tax=Pontibaca salina TaxID=2795731 RepID=A0A934HLX7_9RHOB|nr:hypothetical protein [Pontibaca salina]MBI6629326.1 hypothetical protein [Pontibaca salina]
MSDIIAIPENERGVVRIFALDMPPERAKFLREPGAAAQVLGIDALDPAHVEIFPLSDLDELGLAGYLAEGLGVPAAQLDVDRARLNAITGWVMILRSPAFQDTPARLSPAQELTLIASYTEEGTDWSDSGPIPTESARIGSGPPPQSGAQSRRIGALGIAGVLLVLAILILLVILL